MFSIDNIHNDTALEHASESCLDRETAFAALFHLRRAVAIDAVGNGEIVCHCNVCVAKSGTSLVVGAREAIGLMDILSFKSSVGC